MYKTAKILYDPIYNVLKNVEKKYLTRKLL